MDIVIEILSLSLMCFAGLTLYTALMSAVLPRYVMRITYSLTDMLGRGLRKYTYPEGRGISYEPHPSVRKYVRRYALFTHEGYKYVQLLTDIEVKSLCFSIIMLNNRDKVIDVIDVSANLRGAEKSAPILLHGDTSYIALSVREVNARPLEEHTYLTTRVRDIALYFGAVALMTFLEFCHISFTVGRIFECLDTPMPFELSVISFLLPSVGIAAVSALITVLGRISKGVKVVLK